MDKNAWLKIKPDDYDAHMSHPHVGQTQTLNKIIKEQFKLIPANKRAFSCVAILGITNGNGLEHVISLDIGQIIGIDISREFLKECQIRYSDLHGGLTLYQLDLIMEIDEVVKVLSQCDLIIANLLIEHIHLKNFSKMVMRLPKHGQCISCVIQANPDGSVVSKSGMEYVFNDVVKQAEEENENALRIVMKDCGYSLNNKLIYDLPNGKQLIRLDYCLI